jgi:hypothetical protein
MFLRLTISVIAVARDHIDDSLCSERQQPGILGAAQVISVRSTHVRPQAVWIN